MLTFKDMTFCPYYQNCTDSPTCSRKLTPELQAEAVGSGLPLLHYVAPPKCHTHWKDREDLSG